MKRKTKVDTFPLLAIVFIIVLAALLFGPGSVRDTAEKAKNTVNNASQQVTDALSADNLPEGFTLAQVPEYSGSPYAIINDGIPYFTADEITSEPFEYYGDLDLLGRCTVAFGCYGLETVPPQGDERGDISSVIPTGWEQAQYSNIDDGDPSKEGPGWLYNRCHLAAWCISDEDANPNNLITGTRYMNVDGMWVWESKVQDYIYDTGAHIMYRVTPVYNGGNLLAEGVLMEAYSVEDNGATVTFCVFCYNEQPGIEIDHRTGVSKYSGVYLDTDASTVVYEH